MKHSQAFEKLVADIMPHIKEVSIEQVLDFQKAGRDFLFVDVREDHEWSAGRAPGAVHIGRGILERDIDKHAPALDREMILYCGGGYRSALAADNLQKMGYNNVFSMAGGIRRWRELGLAEDKD